MTPENKTKSEINELRIKSKKKISHKRDTAVVLFLPSPLLSESSDNSQFFNSNSITLAS
jgi:hypothetical protein